MKTEKPKKKPSPAKISYGKSKSSFKAKPPFGRSSDRSDRRSPDRRRDYSRSDEERVSHKIICAECGKEDTVPFIPTSNKPVLCKDCFGQDDRRDTRGRDSRGRDNRGRDNRGYDSRPPRPHRDFDRPDHTSKKLDEINKKLDTILALLALLEIDEIDELDALNAINEIDETDELDAIDETVETDETD